MGDQRSRLGAANLSIPLMLLTFLVIGGFLWWLNMSAETASVTLREESDDSTPQAASGAGGAVAVTEEDLRTAPERFEGQVVRITLPVAMAVGTQAFFLDVTDSPFLVKLSDALLQQGQTVPQGQVTVTGPMLVMTDSIRQDWLSRGIVPASEEILVEFATHFIDARAVAAAAAAPTTP